MGLQEMERLSIKGMDIRQRCLPLTIKISLLTTRNNFTYGGPNLSPAIECG